MVQRRVNGSSDEWISFLDGAPIDIGLASQESGVAVYTVERTVERAPVVARADDWGVTADDVLVAAWTTLLHRYTDQADLLVGRGTNKPESILRILLAPTTTTYDIAREAARLRSEQTGRSLDLTEILAAIGAEAPADRHPIFQVGYATSPSNTDATHWSAGFVPCDLLLHTSVSEHSVHLTVQVRGTKSSGSYGERLGDHLVTVLRATTTDDNPRTIPLLTGDELAELAAWNQTTQSFDEVDVAGLFSMAAKAYPNVCALEFREARITYAELDEKANNLAEKLKSLGVAADVPVAISVERSPALVVSVLATLKAKGTYVPVDVSYPQDRRQYMLDDSQPAVVLSGPDADGNVIITPTGHRAKKSDRHEDERLGYLIYTSGSTGQPKGVALPERALRNLVHWQLSRPGFVHGARTLQFTSLSFDVSFQEIMSTLCSGGTLVLVDDATRRNPLSFHRVVVDSKIERLFLPFVALRGLANAACSTKEFPSLLTEVYTAGEQLVIDETMREFLRQLPSCVIENQYGPSESHVVSAYTVSRNPTEWEALPPIGSPIANTKLFVLDPARQHRPVGVSGELYIAGVCLADGYLGQPEMTAERFVDVHLGEPFHTLRLYRTGDLVHWRSDGSLVFQGRIDTQVKFRGFRVELGEIGAVLSAHPDVDQAVAVVRQGDGAGARLVAFCTPSRSTVDVSLESLHSFAQQQLPVHMVPSHYGVIDKFPLTPSGKVDISSLDTPEFDRSILGNEFRAPLTATELQLASVWDSLLGINGVGATDDFFALGGDSLMAVEMFAKIRETFDRELPLGALAQNPTIEGLAVVIDGGAVEWPILVPIRRTGSRNPFFCIHGGTGNVASFPNLARQLPAEYPFYGLQWDGLDGSAGTEGIVNLATRYLQEVRAVQPHGPYVLAGQCVGGLIAQEMARLLLQQGEEVPLLVMYDSPNLSGPHYVSEPLKERAHMRAYVVKRRATDLISSVKSGGVSPARLRASLRPSTEADHDVFHKAGLAMIRTVTTYQPHPVPVRTIYLGSGERVASRLSLKGSWTDDFLGFSAFQSPRFVTHLVGGGHNDLLYSPEAVRVVTEALAELSDSTTS